MSRFAPGLQYPFWPGGLPKPSANPPQPPAPPAPSGLKNFFYDWWYYFWNGSSVSAHKDENVGVATVECEKLHSSVTVVKGEGDIAGKYGGAKCTVNAYTASGGLGVKDGNVVIS
jgi:hypothetical protein